MSSTSLSTDGLLKRVASTVGKQDAGALTQPAMRPDHGYVSLVSVPSFFYFAPSSSCLRSLLTGVFVRPQGLRIYKPVRPPVLEDAVGRAAWRITAEKEKEKKDAKKARARERMRARDTLEKLRRRQAREGLPREPSPETPDDDDDDDGDEDDDMAAHLGLSPDPRPGQGSSSQPPSGSAPSEPGAGTPRTQSEERRQAEGVLDPLAEVTGVTPGSKADLPALLEQVPAPAAQKVGPLATTTPRQAALSVPRASEAEAVPKPASEQPSVAPAVAGARGASPQARLALVRSG
jgi:hypothetical protein